MRKTTIFFGLLMIMSINLNAIEVEYSGYLRLGYQNFENNVINENDIAIGGKLNIELQHRGYFAFGVSFYTTNALSDKDNIGVPFYSSENESYTILGEAYLKAKVANKTTLKIGRQSFDSPFANTDDIGIIPNTFEGAILKYQDTPKRNKIVLAYLNKWSGVDSDEPQNFTKMNGDDGVYILGGAYGGLDNTQLKAWLYHIPNIAKLAYFVANYNVAFNDINLAFAGQYSIQDYENSEKSTIYGASIEASYEPWGVTTTLSYNAVDGIGADNFFGGGPFLTSSEHITIPDGGENAKALLIGGSFDFATVGIENLTLSLNHLTIERELLDDITELDVTLEYNYSDNLNVQLIYSDVEDKSFADESFKDVRVFVNYSF
ncbi:MAG: OprD family outer membrane porin [Campylobacterota bacterium]|nr:OprD family outer membrane porin [Campylobacterota bacterium]